MNIQFKNSFVQASLTLLIALHSSAAFASPPPGKWRLAFEDNFDSVGVDKSKWNIRGGVRRDAFWGPEALVATGDGNLRIQTVYVNGKVVSGSIDTRTKFEQRYGYFEARCKLPKVAGHWSAFWLLAREFGKTDSAQLSGSEVDIFEYHTLMGSQVNHAVHWPKYGPTLQSRKGVPSVQDIRGFHVFGLLWEKDRYVFFVDGKQTWVLNEGVSGAAHYVLLSNEVGTWAGPLNQAGLPDEMVCDYVRVYAMAE